MPADQAPSLDGAGNPSERSSAAAGAEALERLTRLRTVLPALGEELAGARREAAHLRSENRRLREQIDRHRLDRQTRYTNAVMQLHVTQLRTTRTSPPAAGTSPLRGAAQPRQGAEA